MIMREMNILLINKIFNKGRIIKAQDRTTLNRIGAIIKVDNLSITKIATITTKQITIKAIQEKITLDLAINPIIKK